MKHLRIPSLFLILVLCAGAAPRRAQNGLQARPSVTPATNWGPGLHFGPPPGTAGTYLRGYECDGQSFDCVPPSLKECKVEQSVENGKLVQLCIDRYP